MKFGLTSEIVLIDVFDKVRKYPFLVQINITVWG